MRRTITSLATLALLGTLLAGTAYAHAKFVSSTPAPGQTVATAPATVTLTFSEELGTGSIGSVKDANGATVSTGATISNDHLHLAIALKAALPNGVYAVSWHSVAADDGGILEGTFQFGVGVPVPSTATLPATNTTGLALTLIALATILGLASVRTLRPGKA